MLRSARFVPVFCLVVWLPLVALSGCATLPRDLPGVPAGPEIGHDLLADWLTRSARHRSLQGLAKVKVQTAERTISGSQVVLAEAPDRLRAETLSPFGTPLLLLAANGAELGVLLPGDNLLYRGQATPENLGRFTRLPLRLADLVGILLYRPPLIAYQRMATWLQPDGGWLIEFEAGPRRQLLLFDASRRLSGVRYLLRGEPQLHIGYSDFDEGQAGLPRSIELQLPQQNTRASLDFSEFSANRELAPEIFTLQSPPGATIIVLDESTTPGSGSATGGDAAVEQTMPQQKGSE